MHAGDVTPTRRREEHCRARASGSGLTAHFHFNKDFLNGYVVELGNEFVLNNPYGKILTSRATNRVAPASHAGELHWNLNDLEYLEGLTAWLRRSPEFSDKVGSHDVNRASQGEVHGFPGHSVSGARPRAHIY